MTQTLDSEQEATNPLGPLEEDVDKLVIALDEWRQWKLEYEALRKDVQALSATATRAVLGRTRLAFRGELVDEKELVDIFGRDDSRKRDQVISTVSNRLEYVTRNITTLTKQLQSAENQLATTRVAGDSEVADEDGLQFTEINEQLDDDDNVISFSLRQPGDSQSQLLDVLEKVGMTEASSNQHESTSGKSQDASNSFPTVSSDPVDPKRQPQPSVEKMTNIPEAEQVPKKKSVTFTGDTKEATQERPLDTVQKLEELYRQAKDQERIISDPIRPADESPEDAELREDMIRYNKETMMYEMAPIVAELQLEEGGAEDDDWDSDDSEDDDDDDEDEWGRSTSSVVDDEYRRQMLELRERLSKQTFGEPRGSGYDEADEFAEGIGRITVKSGDISSSLNNPEKSAVDATSADEARKSVKFAPALDIAEPLTSASSVRAEPLEPQQSEVDPLTDVMERLPSKKNSAIPTSGRKPSKFRKERAIEGSSMQTLPIAPEKPTNPTKYAPSGPEGQTMASTILEHEPTNEVKEPDELDANLLHQQVTEEYYKMRNTMIGRHGGFLKENTDAIQPLEEEEGGPKRVSRFKAARLAKS